MRSQNPSEYHLIKNQGQLVDIQGGAIPEQAYYVNSGALSTYFSTNGFDVVYSKVDDDTATVDTLWRVNGHFVNINDGIYFIRITINNIYYIRKIIKL